MDDVLVAAERLWVVVAGGPQRWKSGRSADSVTGRTSFDEVRRARAGEVIWPKIQEAPDRGVPQDDLLEVFDSVTDQQAEKVANKLRDRAPHMLREHRAIRRVSQRRIRRDWGPAFDGFYAVYVCVEEIGSNLQTLHRQDDDPLVEALLGLHARTCLALTEIHALMTQGFPLGAWARTRTMYETAVLASLLSDHGREGGTSDLGERFLRHAAVDELKDLELAVRCGAVVDEEQMAAVRREHDGAIADYGKMFARDYGWARPLFPSFGSKQPVTFRSLEELADVGLERLEYRLGAHHIHASSWGLELSVVDNGDWFGRVTGPVAVGFAEPASVALIAAIISASAVVHGVAPLPEPMDLLALRAVEKLAAEAIALLSEAQDSVGEPAT
jgi:hypothetical protein